jgi:hypothetical protein
MRKSNGYAKTNDDETSKQVSENKEDYSTFAIQQPAP